MKLSFLTRKVCKAIRHYTNCPTCQTQIILDAKVILESPQFVDCDSCHKRFTVIKFTQLKDTIELEIIDHGETKTNEIIDGAD